MFYEDQKRDFFHKVQERGELIPQDRCGHILDNL